MTPTQTILFLILSASGCTIIVSRSDIFKPFRDWLSRLAVKERDSNGIIESYYAPIKFLCDMISCPMCLGVWVGFTWYIIYPFTITGYYLFDMLNTGCLVSLVAYLYFKFYQFLDK